MTTNVNPNTTRKSINASMGSGPTDTGRALTTKANTTLNGESLVSQGIERVSTTEETFEDTKNVKEQKGLFTSLNDWFTYDIAPYFSTTKTSIDPDAPIQEKNQDYNPVKGNESDVGNLYTSASEICSEDKAQNGLVCSDNKPSVQTPTEIQVEKNTNNTNGTASKGDLKKQKVLEVERSNYGQQNDEKFIERKSDSKKPTSQPFVIIEEDRTDNESLQEPGEYSEDTHIRIEVLRAVSPFTFGTRQDFDAVEPRGSQTPMRFYNKNPGRSLGFSADFHQQEYPLEPLLSIAEKAQYLCRPYRHGDYALIPKLVRITIPGRVFRGYLQSADITYQGDDYRSWALDQYKPTEAMVNHSLPYYEKSNKNNPYYEYPIEEKQTSRIRNDISPLGNDREAIDYGLSEISIRFDLLITEEIKLTSFMTNREKQELAEAEEAAKKRKELEDALEKANDFLKRHPEYDRYMPIDLVLVDKETGEYTGLLFDESTDMLLENIPEGSVTYKQYLNSKQLKPATSNQDSGLSAFLMKLPAVTENRANSEDMLNYLIQAEHNKYPAKDITKIESELKDKYKDNQDLLLEDYRNSVLMKNPDGSDRDCLGYQQAEFLSMNYNVNINPKTGEINYASFNIPGLLRKFLDVPVGDEKLFSDLTEALSKVAECINALVGKNISVGCTSFIYKEGWKRADYGTGSSDLGFVIYNSNGEFDIHKQFVNMGVYVLNGYKSWNACGFKIGSLADLKILTSSEIQYLKAHYKQYSGKEGTDETIITFYDIYKDNTFLYYQNGSTQDRSFLDHVLKTLKLFQENTYNALSVYIQKQNEEFKKQFLNMSDSDIDEENKNIINRRNQKVFSDKESKENQFSYDNSKPFPIGYVYLPGRTEAIKYNYCIYYITATE